MKIKEFFRKNVEATTASIKFINEQPLNSLGQIIPVGMVVASMVGFIVAIIKFIIAGGFSNQITSLKGDFFGGISEGFTSGTASVLTSGIVSTIISILLFAELLVLIISYYKTENKAKKIVASICLGIGTVLFGVAGFILAVGFGVINLSEQMEMKIVEMLTVFDGMQTSTIVNGLKITAIIGVVALIVFVILMLVSEHKWMIKNTAIALLLSYVILPLVLLLVENIIPMIVGVVAIVVIGGAIFLGGKIFLSGSGESSGSSSVGGSVGTSSSTSRTESKPKEKYQQKKEYDLNTTFWRDKGGYGIAVPQADCIYMKNAWGEKTYVCTVHDFEKGNVAIINKRVRVTNVAGCKTPER
jgi:hypothetical protein